MEQVKIYSMAGRPIDLTTIVLPPQEVLETQKDQLNDNVMAEHKNLLVVADMDNRVTHLGGSVNPRFVVETLGWHVEGYTGPKPKASKTDDTKKAMPEVVARSVEADQEEPKPDTSKTEVDRITPEKARGMAAATVADAVGGSKPEEPKPEEPKPEEPKPEEPKPEEPSEDAEPKESGGKSKGKGKGSKKKGKKS